jgi:hypothetical protein
VLTDIQLVITPQYSTDREMTTKVCASLPVMRAGYEAVFLFSLDLLPQTIIQNGAVVYISSFSPTQNFLFN